MSSKRRSNDQPSEKFLAEVNERAEKIFCPVCGYYCLGKGGVFCIDKPNVVKNEHQTN